MKYHKAFAASLLTGLAFTSTAAFAQSYRLICHIVDARSAEPLGDRDGHAMLLGQVACRVEGGPMDGGMLTGTTISEWDKGNSVLLSGSGVTRKPGATTAYQHTEGKTSLVVADGKVTGMALSGRGRVTMATGGAAGLLGKTYSYTGKTTAPGMYVLDAQYD